MVKCCVFFISFLFALALSEKIKIAIIGAGAGGTSCAYHLHQFLGDRAEIHLFEKSDRIGGRVRNINIDGITTEVGGSIFHSGNKWMHYFADKFNLTKLQHITKVSVGIWNGKSFVFTGRDDFTTKINFLWRYGMASRYFASSLSSDIFHRWMKLYDVDQDGNSFVWESPMEFATKLELHSFINQTSEEYFSSSWISKTYIHEIIAGQTREAYNQNVNSITAIAGSVAIYGSGKDLFKIKEGNSRIFESLAKDSKANLRMNESVKSISLDMEIVTSHDIYPSLNRKKAVYYVATEKSTEKFDYVVIATPLESGNIKLPFKAEVSRLYRTVHVTLVKGIVSKSSFGLSSNDQLPGMIITSTNSTAPFNSMSRIAELDDEISLYKFFSAEPLTEGVLNDIFSKYTIAFKTTWKAYPELTKDIAFPSHCLATSIYYLNALESIASAIEVSLIAGHNIAKLISQNVN